MNTKRYLLALIPIFIFLISGCEKYLDAKPDHRLAVPETLADLQALMDDYSNLISVETASGEVSSDDYYLTNEVWAALTSEDYKRMYIWEKDQLFTNPLNNWSESYQAVYQTNTVLEQLAKLDNDDTSHRNVKGQALFFRGKFFLKIAWLWALAYDPATAGKEPGIPLRLNTNFNEVSRRSTISETYTQIVDDLREAAALLPANSIHPMRPSRPAAFGMLARTYLSMGDYIKAGLYADSCLALKNSLLDYNDLNPASAYPVPQFNTEVIWDGFAPPPAPLSMSRARINDALYQSYAANDLRKVVFFRNNNNGSFAFKGTYDQGPLFMGIATDEIYLIRAECYARAGNISAAMADLNALLIKRWKKNTFVPFTVADQASALNLVLTERRKELLMRGLRWADLKRLNREGAGITISRSVNNQIYTLSPNDLRYALPIPEDVIQITGMEQNRR